MPDWDSDYTHGPPKKRLEQAGVSPKRIGSSPGDALKAAGPFLHVGIQVGLTMAVAAGLGYLIDGWLDTSPWGILIGSLLGVIAVFVVLVRLVAELNAASAKRYGKGAAGAHDQPSGGEE